MKVKQWWTKISPVVRAVTLMLAANAMLLAQEPQDSLRPTYVLGPNDQILIRAFQLAEIHEKPFRVEDDGMVNLPLLGRLNASGLSIQEFEALLVEKLKSIVRDPQVSVIITAFRSEPIFFVGAFKTPGIYPLQGRRTLVEMLSRIGGVLPTASRRIKLIRRKESGPIPLPNVVEDPQNKASAVEISLGSLRGNVNPAEDIVLQPYDVITVERAEMVYVNGEVGKIGGVELGERESLSVLQLLSLAGGASRDANITKVRVLRPVLSSSRRAEILVNIKQVLAGKEKDLPLLPNDVLYVPRSSKRTFWKAFGYTALAAIPTITVLATR